MNPAPDQPPVPTVPSVPTVGSTPNPQIPITPPPIQPPSTNYTPQTNNTSPPLSASPQPFVANAPQDKPTIHHKFPFMMVTLFLVIVLAGFAGSFLFFSYSGKPIRKTPTQILITSPVSMAPTAIPTIASANPFATPSSELANPFASPSASVANPFGTYQNPFQSASPSGNSDQPYQNPFEKLK